MRLNNLEHRSQKVKLARKINKGIGVFVLSFLWLLIAPNTQAQHTPLFSQYMFNTLAFNPAYAGSQDVLTTAMVYRNQWAGFPDAPKTQTLSAHAPLKGMNAGLGILLFNDNVGVMHNSGIYANYSYILRTHQGKMAFGLKGGASFARAKWAEVVTSTGSDPVFIANSQVFFLPNFGAGFYYWDKKFTFGCSVPELLTHRLGSLSDKFTKPGLRNILITGSMTLELDKKFDVTPSVLVQRNYSTGMQVSVGANLTFENFLVFGIAHRSKDASIALFAVQLNKQLRMGYSYDFTLSALRKFSSGSHEIMLQYKFGYTNYSMNPRSFF